MKGTVVSNKMTNTIVVSVSSTKIHTKYGKRVKSRKRYSAHCKDASKFAIGQEVEIVESRPISKTVKMVVVEQ
jgi:small subunit ribosomal protein S17